VYVTIEPPKPHSVEQNTLMEFFIKGESQELWMPCGTKFGKTLGASTALATAGLLRPGSKWRWVGPIYEQAKLGFTEMQSVLPKKPYVDVNLAGPRITTAKGTVFEFWHGQKPTSLEGAAIDGYVLDEFAKMKGEVYESAFTTTTRTLGGFVVISTPLGKGFFYKKCMEAKEEMEWALKRGKVPKKLFITAPTSANPYISKERIKEAKERMPERLYRQFYLAEFLDDASVFVGVKNTVYGELLEFTGHREFWFDENPEEKAVVIGVDWAKKRDYTVFVAIDYTETPRKIVGFLRFHQQPYTTQVGELIRFCRKFKQVEVVYHDKTGVGEALDDMLAETYLSFEGITFTNATKAEMVNLLIMTYEQGNIRTPNWGTMLGELDAYEVKFSAIGNMSYGAPEGLHDDCVSSLMLANAAAEEYSSSSLSVKVIEEKENTSKKESDIVDFSSYFNKLIEDDDDDFDNEIKLF